MGLKNIALSLSLLVFAVPGFADYKISCDTNVLTDQGPLVISSQFSIPKLTSVQYFEFQKITLGKLQFEPSVSLKKGKITNIYLAVRDDESGVNLEEEPMSTEASISFYDKVKFSCKLIGRASF